jgi:FKBP-type peptidyl-prolyl cis-trans isomerase SlyD
MTRIIKDLITEGKYVELMYQVIDVKARTVLTGVEFPLGYVHGVNEILAPAVMRELEGRAAGDTIEVPIDCSQIYGPRDEALVIIDKLHNVPEAYREVGTAILMENGQGQTKTFLVTRISGDTIVFDGNNPLCGRQVIFRLDVLLVRDATEAEMEYGGKVESGPELARGTLVSL